METKLTFNGSRDQAATFILNFADNLDWSYAGEAFASIEIDVRKFSTYTQVRLKEIGRPSASGDIRIQELPSAKSLLLVRLVDDSADLSKWWKSCLDEMRKLKLLNEAQTTDATPQAQPTATWRGNGKPPRTRGEKIAAVKAWDAILPDERPKLLDWLMENFGTDPATGMPLVPEATFHGWRKLIPKS